jgi:hypothetical protein
VPLDFPEVVPRAQERYFADLFEELGYRVQLVRYKNFDEYRAAVYLSPDQVQASTAGWTSDYPTASDFFLGAPPVRVGIQSLLRNVLRPGTESGHRAGRAGAVHGPTARRKAVGERRPQDR